MKAYPCLAQDCTIYIWIEREKFKFLFSSLSLRPYPDATRKRKASTFKSSSAAGIPRNHTTKTQVRISLFPFWIYLGLYSNISMDKVKISLFDVERPKSAFARGFYCLRGRGRRRHVFPVSRFHVLRTPHSRCTGTSLLLREI